jgi:hypothetical protein
MTSGTKGACCKAELREGQQSLQDWLLQLLLQGLLLLLLQGLLQLVSQGLLLQLLQGLLLLLLQGLLLLLLRPPPCHRTGQQQLQVGLALLHPLASRSFGRMSYV